MLMIEPGPSRRDLFAPPYREASAEHDHSARFVGSGKAAIQLILSHLHKRGVLRNKMEPILVPPWLGISVYSTMLPHGFPMLEGAGAKVALIYHQYGFPQNMDRIRDICGARQIVMVEDCAHACASSFRGEPLGSIGEYSLFSYSKFAFCFALGGVRGPGSDFEQHVDNAIAKASKALRLAVNGFKYLDERHTHRETPRASRLINGLRAMAYARYPDQVAPGERAIRLWLSKRNGEISERRENYRQLRSVADRWGLCDHLEADGVTPYSVPLAVHPDKMDALVGALAAVGIQATKSRFDFVRCVFEPDFRPTVVVPIHSQMSGTGLERLSTVISRTF